MPARADIEQWYVERFLRLQRGAFADPSSYFHRYADPHRAGGASTARSSIWAEINGPTWSRTCCRPVPRADLVLRKGADHAVASVLLRKV